MLYIFLEREDCRMLRYDELRIYFQFFLLSSYSLQPSEKEMKNKEKGNRTELADGCPVFHLALLCPSPPYFRMPVLVLDQ